MMFDLTPAIQAIRVTAQYSNAVLVAILPHISNVSAKLHLPLPHPVAATNVVECSIKPTQVEGNIGVEIGLKGGWFFQFDRGYVRVIQSPGEFFTIQDFDRIPSFYGEVKMSKVEAIEFARRELKKLGIPLESVFAEQEPRITEPPKFGTNTVPHYRVQWLDPRGNGMSVSVDMDINANTKQIERIALSNKSLERPPPKLSVTPPPNLNAPQWPMVNPKYAQQLVPFVLRAITEYAQKLSLPITLPVATNHIAKFRVSDNDGVPYCEVDMTNDWRFLYEGTRVTGYYAPNDFFTSQNRRIRIKEFTGSWKLDEKTAMQLVKSTVAKLDYPTNVIHFEVTPKVQKSALSSIPRIMFRWFYSRPEDQFTRSTISAEVNADKGELTSLYCGDISFSADKPPIDAPISLPRQVARPSTKPMEPPNGSWKIFQPNPK